MKTKAKEYFMVSLFLIPILLMAFSTIIAKLLDNFSDWLDVNIEKWSKYVAEKINLWQQ